jgi:hypothetical protein
MTRKHSRLYTVYLAVNAVTLVVAAIQMVAIFDVFPYSGGGSSSHDVEWANYYTSTAPNAMILAACAAVFVASTYAVRRIVGTSAAARP